MAHTAVYGIYSTRQDAEMAIDSMRAAGFRAEDISVLFPDNEGTKDIGHEKHTKAPEKATAGAAIAGIAEAEPGLAGWDRRARDSGLGPLHRRRSDHGRSGRRRQRAASSAAWPERWWAREFPSTKPNATKAASAKEESCCPSIAMTK